MAHRMVGKTVITATIAGFSLLAPVAGYGQEKPDWRPRWGFSGGLGIGTGYTALNAMVYYELTPYVATELGGFYYSLEQGSFSRRSLGPDIALRLQLPNATMVTPFVGVGVGYESWRISRKGDTLEDTGSVTRSLFGGIAIDFSPNVALQIFRKAITYVQRSPISLEEGGGHEPKTRTRTGFGLLIRI